MFLKTIENLKNNLTEKEYKKAIKSLDTIAFLINEVIKSNLKRKIKEHLLLSIIESSEFHFQFSTYLTNEKRYYVYSYIKGLKKNATKKIKEDE